MWQLYTWSKVNYLNKDWPWGFWVLGGSFIKHRDNFTTLVPLENCAHNTYVFSVSSNVWNYDDY
jgi:hypothetical protein